MSRRSVERVVLTKHLEGNKRLNVLKDDHKHFQQETNEENLSSIMEHALTDSFNCLDHFSAPQSLKITQVNPKERWLKEFPPQNT